MAFQTHQLWPWLIGLPGGRYVRVAERGPKDPAIWKRLTARADVIAHSLTPKQASLILSSMARSRHSQDNFLQRFSLKFAPSLVSQAEIIDLCGIVSGLSQLNVYQEELFAMTSQRLREVAPQLDARQVSLMANAFVKAGHLDMELFQRLLKQALRQLSKFTAKDAAVMLNAFSQVPDFQVKEWDDTFLDENTRELKTTLEALALRLPDLLPKADLHSLALILNAFAQLQFVQKDLLDLMSQELLLNEEKLTPRQLAMVLNAIARLQLHEPRLIELLSSVVRSGAHALDPQGLCLVANASAKLQLGLETFQVLFVRIPKLLSRFSGRHLAMLCHAWAKAHIHNDDLFELLILPLASHAARLEAHEVAITLYGYAHFRKSPKELFDVLLERFGTLLAEQAVSDEDLFMVANALGRVGWADGNVKNALRKVSNDLMRYISVQAQATFGLQEDIERESASEEVEHGPRLGMGMNGSCQSA
ncbi:unnamed protein product [Durusdinium trenchii]|uniref:RNA-editing substrate-binding complex 6 protein domain-containing protein n=1 Tax=Durusdinium trenchii TaxID=1381693 RepID=A0ABP0SH73_9DINO